MPKFFGLLALIFSCGLIVRGGLVPQVEVPEIPDEVSLDAEGPKDSNTTSTKSTLKLVHVVIARKFLKN